MKLTAKWRLGKVNYILLSLLSVIVIASCYPAASESNNPPLAESQPVESAPESAPEVPPESVNPQLVAQGQILPVTAEVELNGQIIGLEVAKTPQQQATGLMARELLPDDRGMLFPFEPARPVSFWMKNVLISLDMLFIYDGEIVSIARDVPPCEATPCPTYGPGNQTVDYVLELRGGRAAELGLQPGNPVEITWLEETAQ
ncbi:MAG: DUF192 domain-containing protein [Cyanobacteria bacterium P01_C01_bin.120]